LAPTRAWGSRLPHTIAMFFIRGGLPTAELMSL
jgi:hypothetical protein